MRHMPSEFFSTQTFAVKTNSSSSRRRWLFQRRSERACLVRSIRVRAAKCGLSRSLFWSLLLPSLFFSSLEVVRGAATQQPCLFALLFISLKFQTNQPNQSTRVLIHVLSEQFSSKNCIVAHIEDTRALERETKNTKLLFHSFHTRTSFEALNCFWPVRSVDQTAITSSSAINAKVCSH